MTRISPPAAPGLVALLAAVVAAAAPATAQSAPPSAGSEADPVAPASAAPVVETRLVVRVLSNDAKLIGSGVGGARITIRHADTGALLAEGVQEGGTGDTGALLAPRTRDGSPFDTEGAAAFRTSLPLDRPTPVEILAEGPLGTPHATQRASTTLLLVPGHHVEGDGIVLVLHGFTVDLLEAPARVAPGEEVPVRVRVTMLCGCPTEPGGRWDSRGWSMEVALVGPATGAHDAPPAPVAVAPLEYADEVSTYEAVLPVPPGLRPGLATLRVVIVDTDRVNAGMVERPVRIGG